MDTSPVKKIFFTRLRIMSIVILVIPILYFTQFGFTYPPCGEEDILFDLPSFLNDSEIIFEHPMAYVTHPPNEPGAFGKRCSEVGKFEMFLMPIDSNSPGDINFFQNSGYTVENVMPDTHFIAIKRAYIKCNALVCLDSGGPGDTFVLQNTSGLLVTIDALNFKNLDRDYVNKPWNAGYYKDGKRIGDVVIDEKYP